MKRTSAMVDLTLYAALFRDIVAWEPGLLKSLEHDLCRLEGLSQTELVKFVMIDLVKTGKIFDKGLSSGFLRPTSIPSSLGKEVGPCREFLSGVIMKVFSESGRILEDADPNAVTFCRQVLYLSKKVNEVCSDATILDEVSEFARIDSQLRQSTLDWNAESGFLPVAGLRSRLSFRDGYRQTPDLVSHRDECPSALLLVLDRVCGAVLSQFPIFDWRSIRPKHGPGAVADSRSGADKYLFPTWPSKLEGGFPSSYFAQSREDLESSGALLEERDPPSRLIAVPKTLSSPRLIASEPTSHQFIQHGLMEWIRLYLPNPLRSCISFKDQNPSRETCLESSRTGQLATVDLSAASDRLSCWTVERVFQFNQELLGALWASRTRTLVNGVRGSDGNLLGGEFILTLKKFAPMGSGVTFPVQSIVYACAAIAAVLYEMNVQKPRHRNIVEAGKSVRVFGDDIIIPSSAVQSLVLLLQHLELKVNASKSHWQGHFRESCGMDAFKGYDVTPGYLTSFSPGETCQSLASWVEVSNNFHSKGLWFLSEAIMSKIPPAILRSIPVFRKGGQDFSKRFINLGKLTEPTDGSLACLTLTTFCLSSKAMGSRVRMNKHLHRPEVLGFQVYATSEWQQRESHQSLLQYFLENELPLSVKTERDRQRHVAMSTLYPQQWKAGWAGRQRFQLRKRWVSSY